MALFVETLEVSHFRSHLRTTLEVDPRPVALFGANGAGKTNLLEAVSLLSPGRGLRRAKTQDIALRPAQIGWKVAAQVHRSGQIHEIALRSEGDAARTVTLDAKPVPQVRLGTVSRVLWLVPSMDRLWIEGAEGRRRFLDRTTLSFEPGHAQAALDYDRAMRHRNRLLKDQVTDAHWYGALEQQMATAGAAIARNRVAAVAALTQAQDGARTSFPIAELALTHPEAPLPTEADALAAMFAGSRPRDLAAGRTLVGPHRADLVGTYAAKGQPAEDCSTGEQKALLVSLILANARALARSIGAAPILLLDEVSAHLDEGRRRALYDEICALGAQAWMTGTEPALFADFGTRAQRFEITDENGISKAHPGA